MLIVSVEKFDLFWYQFIQVAVRGHKTVAAAAAVAVSSLLLYLPCTEIVTVKWLFTSVLD